MMTLLRDLEAQNPILLLDFQLMLREYLQDLKKILLVLKIKIKLISILYNSEMRQNELFFH